jgi:hypothetical protein
MTRVAVMMSDGLGNQLFQYAAGRALAERLGAQLILDCTPRWSNPRKFSLDRFSIRAQLVHDAPHPIRVRRFRLSGTLGRWITNTFHNAFPHIIHIAGHRYALDYEKQLFEYDAHFERLSGSIYLTGWRQSYRYFDRISNTIRSDLTFASEASGTNERWLSAIKHTNSVCVHVRRGDYLQQDFGICSTTYYARAMQIIRDRTEGPHFFVFSDDLPWCHNHLAEKNLHFVDGNGPDDAADELRLMAACRHHIIANSTFSWWGAWLAEHSDQTVVAPDPWFTRGPPAKDLLPERWIRLPR